MRQLNIPIKVALTFAWLSFSIAEAATPNIVVQWNRQMLQAIAKNPPAPTATCWRMHVVSTSMYDAWAAYDDKALSVRFGGTHRRPVAERTEENKAKAVSYAAHKALIFIFPAQKADFDAFMGQLGYSASGSEDVAKPEGLGNVCAKAILDFRIADGANATNGFTQIVSDVYPQLYQPVNSADPASGKVPGGSNFDPNHWQPLRVPTGTVKDADGVPIANDADPTSFTDQKFLTPHWGAVIPFALTSPNQFRASPPPAKGSSAAYTDALGKVTTEDAAWNEQTDAVIEYSANLTDEQKVIAEFWADGPKTWTPPGHWNQIAEGLAIRDNQSIDDSVKMYFALNGGLLDAGIACWEAKRAYDFIRPQSAIRHKYAGKTIRSWGGPNKGTQTIKGEDWRPYQSVTFVTPAFPEYTSGHSTFSRCAREVLYAFTKSDAMYDGKTMLGADYDNDGQEDFLGQHIKLPGSNSFEMSPLAKVTLRWNTLLEAADEAGVSRRYGGIHFQDGDLRAREVGRQVGIQAFAVASALWLGQSPPLRIGRTSENVELHWSGGYWGPQSAASLISPSWSPLPGRSPVRFSTALDSVQYFRLQIR